jgi:hypothetical protein
VPGESRRRPGDAACWLAAQSRSRPPQNAAQSAKTPPPEKPKENSDNTEEKKGKKEEKHRGSIVIAPLPIVSPAIGSGVIPIAGYIFPFSKNDKVSPPSTVGGLGLITNNGTRAWSLGGQLSLKQNTYEVTAGYVHGNLDYNLYGIGIIAGNAGFKLPLEQTGYGFFAEALRRIVWKVFVGPRFADGNSFLTLKPTSGRTPPIPPDIGIHTTLRSLGIRVVRDTRQNHFYPVAGSKLEFTDDFFVQALGSKPGDTSIATCSRPSWNIACLYPSGSAWPDLLAWVKSYPPPVKFSEATSCCLTWAEDRGLS